MWKKEISLLPTLVFLAGWGCLLLEAIRTDAVHACLMRFSTGIQVMVTFFFLGYLGWLLSRCVFTGLEKAFLFFWSLPLLYRALMTVIVFFSATDGESEHWRFFPSVSPSLFSLAGDCLIWGVIGLLARPKARACDSPAAGFEGNSFNETSAGAGMQDEIDEAGRKRADYNADRTGT